MLPAGNLRQEYQLRISRNSMELSNEYQRIQSCPEAVPAILELLLEQSEFVDRSTFSSTCFLK